MDLSFDTYRVIRFNEYMGPDDKPVWYFFPDQCRHCLEPSCREAAQDDAPDGIVIDAGCGAVIYTDGLKKADAEDVMEACPFHIPRVDPRTGLMAKCTMCRDRVNSGLLPACVKTCPSGAMEFGDRDKMVQRAKDRLTAVKPRYPKALVTGLNDLRVFHLLTDEPMRYHRYAGVERAPALMDRKAALARIGKSLEDLSAELRWINRIIG
jgi:formate dehydrogenase iron-sulfur subunit